LFAAVVHLPRSGTDIAQIKIRPERWSTPQKRNKIDPLELLIRRFVVFFTVGGEGNEVRLCLFMNHEPIFSSAS
jgi:hypothetical protein